MLRRRGYRICPTSSGLPRIGVEVGLDFVVRRDSVSGVMISLTQAHSKVEAHVRSGPAVSVDLSDALGRVLAGPVVAAEFFPDGDRGTMDGYVVRAEQAPVILRLVGEIRAGDVPERALRDGEALRIFTGGLIPEGCPRERSCMP